MNTTAVNGQIFSLRNQ